MYDKETFWPLHQGIQNHQDTVNAEDEYITLPEIQIGRTAQTLRWKELLDKASLIVQIKD